MSRLEDLKQRRRLQTGRTDYSGMASPRARVGRKMLFSDQPVVGCAGLARSEFGFTRSMRCPMTVRIASLVPSLTELLSMAMRYEGWQVSTAASGGQAVKVARETRPDAIVLDMMLPDFDGLEVMRRIKQALDPNGILNPCKVLRRTP